MDTETAAELRRRILAFGGFQRAPTGEFWISRDDVLRLIDEVLGPIPSVPATPTTTGH